MGENKRIAEINAERARRRGYLVFATDPSWRESIALTLKSGRKTTRPSGRRSSTT